MLSPSISYIFLGGGADSYDDIITLLIEGQNLEKSKSK